MITLPQFAAKRSLYSTVAALFSNGEQGTWFDPSDVSLNWRRNLLTYTEQFDNAAWTKTNATVTANVSATTDPLGGNTADKIIENTASGVHRTYQTITTVVGQIYTQSIYAKIGERRYFSIRPEGNINYAVFDLQLGTVTATNSGTSATITPIGNGWYKCTASRVATSTAWNSFANLQNADGEGGNSYTGDGTSGIYIWGAQLEVGTSPTSYQRIVTPEITYIADVQPLPILYQDAAGTTPVTAVEQPVSLMLDKSQGLAIGPELVDTMDEAAGWTAYGTNTVEDDGDNGVKITYVDNASGAFSTFSEAGGLNQNLVVGKFYKITGQVKVNAGSSVTIVATWTGSLITYYTITSETFVDFSVIFNPSSPTTNNIRISSMGAGEIAWVRNISVKEISGNHAYQTTSTARPVLRSRYNLLTYSEQFDVTTGGWAKTNTTVTANATTAPDGINKADKIKCSLTTPNYVQQTVALTANVNYTFSVKAKASEVTSLWIVLDVNGNAGSYSIFDLSSGTRIQGAGTVATITDIGDGWYQCTVSTTPISSFNAVLTLRPINATEVDDGLFLTDADLRVSNDALNQPSYQRVGAGTAGTSSTAGSTDYDTVGFKPYLSFDGTDDFMVTNSIDFTGTDKMTVVAGVRKFNSISSLICEMSTAFINITGNFALFAPPGPGSDFYGWYSRGNNTASVESSGFPIPHTGVLVGIGNISGDKAILRVNGSQVGMSTTDQGSGNYNNAPIYIGRRGGTSNPLNGRLYGLIVRGAQSTDAEITNTETWMNNKTGAY